jgi:hypothetical protein
VSSSRASQRLQLRSSACAASLYGEAAITGRSAGTVKKTWLNASNTVFRWALEQKHVSRNPLQM